MLTLADYQTRTATTASYPGRGANLAYPTLGLAGEAGEVCEKVLSAAQPTPEVPVWVSALEGWEPDPDPFYLLAAEVGDTLWYAASVAFEAGLTLAEVCRELVPSGEFHDLDELSFTELQECMADELSVPFPTPERAAMAFSVAAARVCERVKKVIRDEAGVVTPARQEGILVELAGFLRAAALLCATLGADLGEVAQANLDKLAARAAANTLRGEGDIR